MSSLSASQHTREKLSRRNRLASLGSIILLSILLAAPVLAQSDFIPDPPQPPEPTPTEQPTPTPTPTCAPGTPCDDGLFCTTNDKCDANGVCKGEEVGERDISEVSISLGALNKIIEGAENKLKAIGILTEKFPELSGEVTQSLKEECCEQKKAMTQISAISGSLSAEWGSPRIILQAPPWSGDYTAHIFGRTIGVQYGAFVQVTLSASVTVERSCHACTGTACWTVEGGANIELNGGLLGNIANPVLEPTCGVSKQEACSIIRLEGVFTSGIGASVTSGCDQIQVNIQFSGVTAALNIVVFEGTWLEGSLSASKTLIDPSGFPIPPIPLPRGTPGTCQIN